MVDGVGLVADIVLLVSEKRSQRRLVLGGVTALLAVWLVACGWLALSAKSDVDSGLGSMNGLSSLSTKNTAAFIDAIRGTTSLQVDLLDSAESFRSANSTLGSPVLAPMRVLPVIGRQLRSLDALTGAAATTTRSASTAIDSIDTVLEESSGADAGSTQDRLTTTAGVATALTTLQADISDLDLGPSEGLVGPVNDARNQFIEEYQQVDTTVDTALTGVTGVHDFLRGPNRYLVMASNNAEMRAGSGMFLQIGTMDAIDGSFTLGEFEATADLQLDQPGATLDAGLEPIWGPLSPTQDFRNVNLTPRFDESARLASQMWEASGGGPVDGVLSIDVVGLKRLLKVVGPVEIQGLEGPMTISAENVQKQLLLKQYQDAQDEETGVRRASLGRVAAAVFQSFNERQVSAEDLLSVLQDSGSGRHLMLWSDIEPQQAGWEALGAAGTLSDNTLMVSVLNRGGNKLDQFLTSSSVLTATTDGDDRRMKVQITLANTTPGGLPRYVAGPYSGTDLAEGEYLGLLSLTVPQGAGNPVVDGAELVASGDDGPTRIIVSNVRIPRNQTAVVTVEFDLPAGWTSVEILPSARVPPMEWTAGDATWTDKKPRLVELDELNS